MTSCRIVRSNQSTGAAGVIGTMATAIIVRIAITTTVTIGHIATTDIIRIVGMATIGLVSTFALAGERPIAWEAREATYKSRDCGALGVTMGAVR